MATAVSKRFAVVTGASSGIGYELAREFARNGFDLVMVAAGDRIYTASHEIEKLGVNVEPLQADLATHEGVHKLLACIPRNGRPVDAIAISAGLGVSGPFVDTDLGQELNTVSMNVTATLHVAKYVLRNMVARGSGRVLFTASVSGVTAGPHQSVYKATKAFMRSMSQSLEEELKDTGVSVTAFLPCAKESPLIYGAVEIAKNGFEAMMAEREAV